MIRAVVRTMPGASLVEAHRDDLVNRVSFDFLVSVLIYIMSD